MLSRKEWKVQRLIIKGDPDHRRRMLVNRPLLQALRHPGTCQSHIGPIRMITTEEGELSDEV